MEKTDLKILWAEDSIGDILLIKEAFEQAGLVHRLDIVSDGAEAMDYLFRRARYARTSHPDLIILDLNMPKKSGKEVIEEIKTDTELNRIPLVVLTSSSGESDVLQGLDPKRSLYIVKPTSFQELIAMANQIRDFLTSLSKSE